MNRASQFRWTTKLARTALLIAAALLVNLLMYGTGQSTVLFFLFPLAIAGASALAGWGYGLLAILMSTLAVLFFFVEPRFTLQTTHAREWERLGLFAFYGLIAVVAVYWPRWHANGHRLRVL
jgi:K+-sensing histidine kinase KdpD